MLQAAVSYTTLSCQGQGLGDLTMARGLALAGPYLMRFYLTINECEAIQIVGLLTILNTDPIRFEMPSF
jgi:hypothetical protein